ncbi:MAG: ATP-dependent 6-phosphofructokinase [Fibrobacterota bacterium]
MEKNLDFSIAVLGEAVKSSPIILSKRLDDYIANYVGDHQRVIYDIDVTDENSSQPVAPRMLMELAGPRENIFFDPSKVSAAVVTCGGLCPGLNDVIRSIVMSLWYLYGVRDIYGIRYGYRGFLPEMHLPPKKLTPDVVTNIHRHGGTILGSARGGGKRTEEIVDALERMDVNMLFAIGGDGTQRGALAIAEEIFRRKKKISVIGIPKTIDNDLSFVEKSFGFETAVSYAVQAVAGAHTEAHDALDGIGIVKVMGRESGFIAAHTALAINDVNFVLVPEVPFDLEGENGLLAALERRLDRRHHAVILVAEGAGQEHLEASAAFDASGNRKMGDVGLFLKDTIASYFRNRDREVNIKYIDPSYIIRSAPANPNDSIYCQRLGSNAVHAAMAGKTACIISRFNNRLVHVPIHLATSRRNKIDPESALWRDVVEATGQPHLMRAAR